MVLSLAFRWLVTQPLVTQSLTWPHVCSHTVPGALCAGSSHRQRVPVRAAVTGPGLLSWPATYSVSLPCTPTVWSTQHQPHPHHHSSSFWDSMFDCMYRPHSLIHAFSMDICVVSTLLRWVTPLRTRATDLLGARSNRSGHTPGRTTPLDGDSRFSFLRKLQNVYHDSYVILPSHEQWTSIPISTHPPQYLLFSVCLITDTLTSGKGTSLWFWLAFP